VDATISWTDPPGGYDVYRGSLVEGASWSFDESCLATGVTGSSVTDGDVPLPSELFFYLVTRATACGESSLGTESSGSDRPNTASCGGGGR
jgi:hypothetical protein